MKRINLKDYYDHISIDTYINVPDEVYNIFEAYRKAEQPIKARDTTTKPTTLLTVMTVLSIEHFVSLSPDEIYERKLTSEQLIVP